MTDDTPVTVVYGRLDGAGWGRNRGMWQTRIAAADDAERSIAGHVVADLDLDLQPTLRDAVAAAGHVVAVMVRDDRHGWVVPTRSTNRSSTMTTARVRVARVRLDVDLPLTESADEFAAAVCLLIRDRGMAYDVAAKVEQTYEDERPTVTVRGSGEKRHPAGPSEWLRLLSEADRTLPGLFGEPLSQSRVPGRGYVEEYPEATVVIDADESGRTAPDAAATVTSKTAAASAALIRAANTLGLTARDTR